MAEYQEPDFLPDVEKVETIFGDRWFGILLASADGSVAWRSPPFSTEEDARRSAQGAFFDSTDR